MLRADRGPQYPPRGVQGACPVISRLHIESFKSLVDVEIDLGQINVFIGANGSGKSNILEALGVLSDAASGRVDDESLLRRGVRPGVPALYKSSFRGAPSPQRIRFTAEADAAEMGGQASYGVGLWNPSRKPWPAWRYHTEKLADDHGEHVGRSPASKGEALERDAGLAALRLADLDPSRPAAQLLRLLQRYAIYAPTTVALRGIVSDQQQREPVGLSGGRLPDAVQEVLRLRRGADRKRLRAASLDALKLIDWASNYATGPASSSVLSPSAPSERIVLEFRDRFMAEGRDTLTAYDASEGALYVLFAMVLCAHPDAPPILAIDNFDHGLNPRLSRALSERMCSWVLEGEPSPQVLLTTHSPLVLDGLDLTDDRVRLFAVDRSSQGRTVVRRINVDQRLRQMAEKGWTLSRLWVMGELGAVPNV